MSASWLIDALLASALLMAAVLLIRGAVRRAFGAQVAYALWALPALRLLLPPMPAGWWRAAEAAPITRAGETVTVYLVEPIASTSTPTLAAAVALIWGGGAIAFLAAHLVRHHCFCRAVMRDAAPVGEEAGVRIVASPAASGPLAFGVVRRVVALPVDHASRYDADERALALAHELGHHRRCDLLANWAALVVLALHWFSPLAWVAFRAFRADQELANDAGVLAGCPADQRHAYGRAIVKAAAPHGSSIGAACHLHTVTNLKGRLRMLTISRASRRRLVAGSTAVAVLVAGGLGLTASSSAAEQVAATLDAPLPTVSPVAFAPAQTAPTPPSPVAPPAGVAYQRKHVVVVSKDGNTRTYEGDEADRYVAEHHLPVPPVPPVPPVAATPGVGPVLPTITMYRGERLGSEVRRIEVPEVTSAHCSGDDTGPAVENRTSRDGRRVTVVCANRIATIERNAESTAENAMGVARASLAMARGAIERDRNLTPDQRKQALAGIAEAEAEAEVREAAND